MSSADGIYAGGFWIQLGDRAHEFTTPTTSAANLVAGTPREPLFRPDPPPRQDRSEEITGRGVTAVAHARIPDKPIGQRFDVSAVLQVEGGQLAPRTMAAASRALRLYRSGLWRKISAYLRHDGEAWVQIRELPGQAPTREHLRDHVNRIDRVMGASLLGRPVQVWRGIDEPAAIWGEHWRRDLSGAEWTEASFCSTSADRQVANIFAGPDYVVMRLHVPAGVGAVQLSQWRTEDRWNAEAELLLQRGLRMRVSADQIEYLDGGTTWRNGRYEVLPAQPYRVLDVQAFPPPPAASV